MSYHSSHTHCQAPQAQTQTKACQRVSLFQSKEHFKIFLPSLKNKLKHPNTRATQTEKNETNDKFNAKVQFDSETARKNNRHFITQYIKNRADTTEIKCSSSLQTLYRFDSDLLRSAQLFIYRNRWLQV